MARMIARENHRLLEARLLISRPEDVFNELQKRGSRAQSYWSFDAWDQHLERSLLTRDEPLIDLALARYATDSNIVGKLYEKASTIGDPTDEPYKKGLRIACLSNHLISVSDLGSFPRDVIGVEATWKVLSEADHDEASALLQNPQIDSKLLNALYRRDEPFASLPEERWTRLIAMSRSNPSINDYHQTDEAIFKLLEIVHPNESWRHVLFPLLEKLHPTFDAPLNSLRQVLERWSFDPQDEDATKWHHYHYLSRPEGFRCLIAALYGRDNEILKEGRTSDDVAMRCALYGNAPLTLTEMKAGDERDGHVFRLAVLFNDHVLGLGITRNAVEQKYLDDEELYRKRCKYHRFRLSPLDQWREEERRKRAERKSERFRFLVLVGLGVLLALAFIQTFWVNGR